MARAAGRLGRKARLDVDTRPGKVLALALLANAPIAVAFVLAPLLARDDPAAGLRWVGFVLWGTPPLAIWSVGQFLRTPPPVRAHRAARIGLLLAATALLLWGLTLALVLRRG